MPTDSCYKVNCFDTAVQMLLLLRLKLSVGILRQFQHHSSAQKLFLPSSYCPKLQRLGASCCCIFRRRIVKKSSQLTFWHIIRIPERGTWTRQVLQHLSSEMGKAGSISKLIAIYALGKAWKVVFWEERRLNSKNDRRVLSTKLVVCRCSLTP